MPCVQNTSERSTWPRAAVCWHRGRFSRSCCGYAQWSPVVQRIGLQNAASLSSDWEGYQPSPNIKDLKFLAHVEQLYGSPLSCSSTADEPSLEETGSWSTIHRQLWSGIQKPLFLELSTESPWLAYGNTVPTSHTGNTEQLQNGKSSLQFSRDLSDALIATNSHTSEGFSAKQILVRLVQMWKLFLLLFRSVTGMSDL